MKTVLIFSGGLDSTVLASYLIKAGHTVLPLSIDYGQRHSREIESAQRICSVLGLKFKALNLSGLRDVMTGSSQTDRSIPVPHGHYTDEIMKVTVVPNRNMILLAVAGAYAISQKADSVSYGAHGGDHAIYPDCRPEFADALAVALGLADWHKVRIDRPFINKTKADIARLGAELGAPMWLSWSCYEGGSQAHCGKCGTCVERKEAFVNAGIPDHTVYAD